MTRTTSKKKTQTPRRRTVAVKLNQLTFQQMFFASTLASGRNIQFVTQQCRCLRLFTSRLSSCTKWTWNTGTAIIELFPMMWKYTSACGCHGLSRRMLYNGVLRTCTIQPRNCTHALGFCCDDVSDLNFRITLNLMTFSTWNKTAILSHVTVMSPAYSNLCVVNES